MQASTTTDSPAPCILQLENLCFQYPQHPLLDGLSARIGAGVSLVLGGDGRGKTTLMRLLAGELPVQSGSLHIHGVSLKEHPQAYRQQLFWIDPRTSAFDQLTPLQFFAGQRQNHPGFLASDAPRLAALDKPSIVFVLKQLATAASDPAHAWVVAHFDGLAGVPLAKVISLGD